MYKISWLLVVVQGQESLLWALLQVLSARCLLNPQGGICHEGGESSGALASLHNDFCPTGSALTPHKPSFLPTIRSQDLSGPVTNKTDPPQLRGKGSPWVPLGHIIKVYH